MEIEPTESTPVIPVPIHEELNVMDDDIEMPDA